jgi:lipoprotein-anchoring transpeptidase ErfK/SrfK
MDRAIRRLVLVLAACVAFVAVPALAQAKKLPERDEAVMVKRYLLGRVSPKIGARGSVHLWTNTGYSYRRAVYPVVAHKTLKDGSEWLKVRVQRRPRGVETWIPAWATKRVWIKYRIVVDLSSRLARVYKSGKLYRRFRVVVGAPGTPTPRGHFYVVDHVRLNNNWARGVWALATSAYSARLKHFDGGDGVIALHGRGYLTAPVGTAASHGCVRFNNRDIRWMKLHIPRGTRIDIQR